MNLGTVKAALNKRDVSTNDCSVINHAVSFLITCFSTLNPSVTYYCNSKRDLLS